MPRDIQTLNEWALEGRLEVTAISLRAYPFVAGPVRAAAARASHGLRLRADRRRARALTLDAPPRASRSPCPGRLTTAFLVLRMALGEDLRYRELPFDEILDEVQSGAPTAGLLIHEGQLTYADEGLAKVLDLGEWWLLETGLPLPLGVNVARRDLGDARSTSSRRCLRESIAAGLANRDEAIAYALRVRRAASTPRPPTGSSRCT